MTSESPDPVFVKYPSTESFPPFVKQFRRIPERPQAGGTFVGTVKLHGSNISVVFRPYSPPQIQSRNRILSATQDSYGAHALLAKVPFEPLVSEILAVAGNTAYEEIVIVMEHCGQSIQKGVALTQLPLFFALFNICIDGKWVMDMRNYRHISLPKHRIFNVVDIGPIFEVTINDLYDDADIKNAEVYMTEKTLEIGKECPFALAISSKLLSGGKEARGPGEGIVWTFIPDQPSDVLVNFKTKSEQFNTTSKAARPPKKPTESDANAEAFVEYACPYGGRRMEQGIEYLVEMHNADVQALAPALTPHFIRWVVEDTIKEEGTELERFSAKESEVKKVITAQARKWYIEQCSRVVW